MVKSSSDIADFSKYEPLRLDKCTVIFDLKKFFDSHKNTVKFYESKGMYRIAKPYRDRGVLAIKIINEIEVKQ
jgi:hypothetical protein